MRIVEISLTLNVEARKKIKNKKLHMRLDMIIEVRGQEESGEKELRLIYKWEVTELCYRCKTDVLLSCLNTDAQIIYTYKEQDTCLHIYHI